MSNNSSFMSNDKNRTIVNSGLTWILVINKMWFRKKNPGLTREYIIIKRFQWFLVY